MDPHPAATHDYSFAFIELGIAAIALGLLSRLASRWRFSAIPLYLLTGLAFGKGGIVPLRFSSDFVAFGSEVGVALLLFMLGLEYTGKELAGALKTGWVAGVIDFALNFTPGVVVGTMIGLSPIAAALLGGITYITSSGVVAKTMGDLGQSKSPESSTVTSILVLEDLAMALYLPIMASLLIRSGLSKTLVAVSVAVAAVLLILLIAIRYGRVVGKFVAAKTDETTLLTIFGLVLLVAGVAQRVQVSAAVGAFLVGVAIAGSIVGRVHRLMSPVRDLFAATFFLFFGLQIDPSSLPPVLPLAIILALITSSTKMAAGWIAAGRTGCDRAGRLRAGAALVARGEFSIVIAGLGTSAGLDERLGPLSAAYVLITAVLGPVLTRITTASNPVSP